MRAVRVKEAEGRGMSHEESVWIELRRHHIRTSPGGIDLFGGEERRKEAGRIQEETRMGFS